MSDQPPLRQAGKNNLLIIADSDTDSNLYYATHFLVPDPMMYLEWNGEKILFLKDLELGRAGKEAEVDRIVAITPYEETLRSRDIAPTLPRILDLFLADEETRKITVPAQFPLGPARRLEKLGFELDVARGELFPERAVKSPKEIAFIREVQNTTEGCMAHVIDRIRECDPAADGTLMHAGEVLTSEDLRKHAHKFLLDHDCFATSTIIAGGDQGCDPHQKGFGPLKANETIVIDIFPRSLKTRYWGDMTRTVVRGRASAAVKKIYRDVSDAQQAAFDLLCDGRDGRDVHEAVSKFLTDRGNPTEEREGQKVGFFHGTGHGIGLDIHEAPGMGRMRNSLQTHQVVTVEPGLYYPGVGAVRLEDSVIITRDGYENLNKYPKELEV